MNETISFWISLLRPELSSWTYSIAFENHRNVKNNSNLKSSIVNCENEEKQCLQLHITMISWKTTERLTLILTLIRILFDLDRELEIECDKLSWLSLLDHLIGIRYCRLPLKSSSMYIDCTGWSKTIETVFLFLSHFFCKMIGLVFTRYFATNLAVLFFLDHPVMFT